MVLGILGALWVATSTGLVSSNDGSHVALARALALRHRTHIDEDVALTLWVDRARRGGHEYSDRPPGTALAAVGAAWIGGRLDPLLLRHSVERRALVFTPAGPRYTETYVARVERLGVPAPPLASLQGTALAITVHAALVGVLGLWATARLARRRGVSRAGQIFGVVAVGACTLWGPYATVLFSHVTAATALALFVLLATSSSTRTDRGAIGAAVGAGTAGAWAIATDYSLLVAVVPLALVCASPKRWPWILAGALPVGLVVAAYHHAAFGSPWSIGYDFQTNFGFARERSSTFSGNPLIGAWTLWGAGRGAGVLARAPIVLVGVAGLVAAGPRPWLIAVVPWLVLLTFHQTPWGGGSEDHRYLVPILPLVGLGLGLAWDRWVDPEARRGKALALGMLLLAAVSAVLVWAAFLAGR